MELILVVISHPLAEELRGLVEIPYPSIAERRGGRATVAALKPATGFGMSQQNRDFLQLKVAHHFGHFFAVNSEPSSPREIWLELDDGAEVHLKPGDCVVQNGTRHAWRNRGSDPCVMAFVMVGAKRS